jgi:carbon storage regulator
MLVLSRREQEIITIGDDIQIVVNRIIGNRVSLGVIAPRDVPVTRRELMGDHGRASGEADTPTQ